MGIRRRVMAVLAATALCLGLCSCGGAQQPADVYANQLEVQQPFEGRVATERQKLTTHVNRAIERGKDRVAAMSKDSEEAELAKKVNKDFKKANKAYREGDFAAAQEGYEGIIKTYPMHYGANVNLALALLQQGKDNDALDQALTCVYLFPKEGAVMLNVQTAGVAMGFTPEHLESAVTDVAKASSKNATGHRAELKGEYKNFYQYNKLWDHIETQLHDIAAERNVNLDVEGATESDAGEETEAVEAEEEAAAVEAEEAEAAEATPADDEVDAVIKAMSAFQTYSDLVAEVEELEQELPDDADVAALSAYLYAVGLQLGLEVDTSLVEPVRSMPFVIADDDLCKIRVVGFTKDKKGEEREVGIEITNKTEATLAVGLRSDTEWEINGNGSVGHLNGEDIPAGETQEFTLQTGYYGDDGLASFAGVLKVSCVEADSVIAYYPLTWAAAE